MAATTIQEDRSAFDRIIGDFGTKKPKKGSGRLVFSGDYWPPEVDDNDKPINQLLYHDVKTAFEEARKIGKAYIAALAASRGTDVDEKVTAAMKKWFGDHDTSDRDWWKGAAAIMGGIETFITSDVNVYYRGDRANKGKPNDYPGQSGSNLVDYDFVGYAESATDVQNNIVGLCEDFFAKQAVHLKQDGVLVPSKKLKTAKIALTGRDSVGGVLIHELSHNICGTLDHCYSESDAIDLAQNHPSRAWYNADSIEYFCEDILYS